MIDSYDSKNKNTKEDIIQWLNTNIVKNCNEYNCYQSPNSWIICPQGLKIIKYKKDEYFKKHTDNSTNNPSDNSTNNHDLKYFTFLVCLKPCQEGGATILYNTNAIDSNTGTKYEVGANRGK